MEDSTVCETDIRSWHFTVISFLWQNKESLLLFVQVSIIFTSHLLQVYIWSKPHSSMYLLFLTQVDRHDAACLIKSSQHALIMLENAIPVTYCAHRLDNQVHAMTSLITFHYCNIDKSEIRGFYIKR